jgi:hypothetical protein
MYPIMNQVIPVTTAYFLRIYFSIIFRVLNGSYWRVLVAKVQYAFLSFPYGLHVHPILTSFIEIPITEECLAIINRQNLDSVINYV